MFEQGTGVWLRARSGKHRLRDGVGKESPSKEVGTVPVWFENKSSIEFEWDKDVAAVPKPEPTKPEREKLWKDALSADAARRQSKELKGEELEALRKKRREEKQGKAPVAAAAAKAERSAFIGASKSRSHEE